VLVRFYFGSKYCSCKIRFLKGKKKRGQGKTEKYEKIREVCDLLWQAKRRPTHKLAAAVAAVRRLFN
jgi:hypothetical protein